jgi:hypothetical protein
MFGATLSMRNSDRIGAHVFQADGFHVFDRPSDGLGA